MHTKNKRKNERRKYGTLFACCCVEAIHSVVYLAPLTLVLVLKLSCLLCFQGQSPFIFYPFAANLICLCISLPSPKPHYILLRPFDL